MPTSPETPHESPEALKQGVRESTAKDLREYALSLDLEEKVPENLGVLNVKDGKYKAPAKNAE